MASKLSKKQLETRDFILTVFRKEAPATKATLKKLMKVYADVENKSVTEKYGEGLISSFLSIYKFKNYDDYREILSIMQHAGVYETGLTYYGTFHSIITKKLFDSESIKTKWIIENIADGGSFAQINNIIGFIFTREKGNEADFLNQIIDMVKGSSSEAVIYEAIVRHGMSRKVNGLDGVLEHIFSLDPKIEIRSIEVRFSEIKDKTIRGIIGSYLYSKTKNEDYLPQAAQDIFLF